MAVSAPVSVISTLDVEALSGSALKASLEVSYGSKVLTYAGDSLPEVTPMETQNCPSFKLQGASPGKYVVIMTDPDAPSKEMPLFREFIHYVVTEVPLGADGVLAVEKGNAVVPYVGCGPPCNSDLHRYIFLVYPQPGADPAAPLNAALGERGGKRAAVAAKDAGLGDPIAFGAFVSQWDESCDALHEAISFVPPPCYRSPKQIEKHGTTNAPASAISTLDVEALSGAGLKGSLEVSYGEKVLTYIGSAMPEVTPMETQNCPSFKLQGAPSGKYVVIMTDPDAPSKETPLFREFIHYVVTEVPLGADGVLAVEKGNAVVPYVGCGPPCNSDLHRYIFLVYPQPGADPAAPLNAALGERGGKRAAIAAKDAGLGDPIAFGVFVSQWDESCDALHEAISFVPPPQYRSPKQIEQHGSKL